MTYDEKMAAIAEDAYQGATEGELRQVFVEQVLANLRDLPDAEIDSIYEDVCNG